MKPTIKDIVAAKETLESVVHRTPLDFSTTFSNLVGSEVYLKRENLQKTGSFKIRGAYVKIASLTLEERRMGVIAASVGNHAQGVAYASKLLGVPCTVVMPATASPAKVSATRGYGARVVLEGTSFNDALMKAKALAKESKLCLIHSFDDPAVIAGQGTIGLEILEDLPNVDAVVVPVGGGGLIGGIAIAAKNHRSNIRVIGVQSEAFAGMKRSLEAGEIRSMAQGETIADGIAVARPGKLPFQIAKAFVDEVVTVSDDEIVKTTFLLMERGKLVVEPAGAAALAYLLATGPPGKARKVAVILSGGNVDMYLLGQIVTRGLAEMKRLVKLTFQVHDRPGALSAIVNRIAELRGNVVEVQHDRYASNVPVGKAQVTLSIETDDEQHTQTMIRELKKLNPP